MLRWAAIFFVIAIIAALFGFTGIAGAAADIARFLFFLFVAIAGQIYGLRITFVYPSMRLSNLSYAIGALSSGTTFETTKLGFARPAIIRSRRWRM